MRCAMLRDSSSIATPSPVITSHLVDEPVRSSANSHTGVPSTVIAVARSIPRMLNTLRCSVLREMDIAFARHEGRQERHALIGVEKRSEELSMRGSVDSAAA